MIQSPSITLKSCPKSWTHDLDKAKTPAETIQLARNRLDAVNLDIVARTRRIDPGRLGIPVFLAECGHDARAIIPARKQMGKGPSPEQAEASALMELMERFAFFSFWERRPYMVKATWSEAAEKFGDSLIPVEEILRSVGEHMPEEKAVRLLDLLSWDFYPATNLMTGDIVWLPLDWFRMLGEFNGSSAGNTPEESLLQGLSELVERHVSALADSQRPVLPTIVPGCQADPVLLSLLKAFETNSIKLVLKDFSLGMPMPTVAALAWDPETLGETSEIVFTAGTATTPAKAAIRAVTEVAQLGGDFCTKSCYEASGLPKFFSLGECKWLLEGPEVSLDSLPDAGDNDILVELRTIIARLAPIQVYGVETTHPDLGIPAHYCIAPGLDFRERDKNRSLGLFIGRKLAEEAPFEVALRGMEALDELYARPHFTPFFRGLLALREGKNNEAAAFFDAAIPLQPDETSKALAAFYAGYARFVMEDWQGAIPHFSMAKLLSPTLRDYASFLGIALFKTGDHAAAEASFTAAIAIDKGSAIDIANRGICRKFLGRIEEAQEDLTIALELDPGLEFASRELANLLKSGTA